MSFNLNPNSSTDNLLTQLIAEYNQLKQQIEQGGLESVFLNKLKESASELQALINKIVAKDKKITSQEYNEAYEKLRESRRNNLKRELSRTKKFFIITGAIGVLALGIYIYKRLRK